jgi:hypothetical protein
MSTAGIGLGAATSSVGQANDGDPVARLVVERW